MQSWIKIIESNPYTGKNRHVQERIGLIQNTIHGLTELRRKGSQGNTPIMILPATTFDITNPLITNLKLTVKPIRFPHVGFFHEHGSAFVDAYTEEVVRIMVEISQNRQLILVSSGSQEEIYNYTA